MNGAESETQQLALVRVAASSRSFLLSGRLIVAAIVITLAWDVAFESTLGNVLGIIVYPLGAVAWWVNRRNAVWLERDASGIRVRTRRWWKYEDLWSGRLRASGTVLQEFGADVPVRFAEGNESWWRSDRALHVGDARFVIFPESVKLARSLADNARWAGTAVRATDSASS